MTTCYLAQPIDFWDAESADDDGMRIEEALAYCEVTAFRPARAWYGGRFESEFVDAINRQIIDDVDFVLARLPFGVPSVGVPMEIEYAFHKRKPVFVAVDPDYRSLVLTARSRQAPETFWVTPYDATLRQQLWDFLRGIEERAEPFETVPPPQALIAGQPVGDNVIRYSHGPAPARKYPLDVGHDLVVSQECVIDPMSYGDIPCGIRIELPNHLFGWVVARSSTFERTNLLVLPGVVDPGYRGEMKVLVWNTDEVPIRIERGERLAQLLILPNLADWLVWEEVGRVSVVTARGTKGFGSTGA